MMRRAPIVTLPGGQRARPVTVKCYRVGCRRRRRGYLAVERSPGGLLYNARGECIADLREQDYACREHGVVDGSAPFLYRDEG